MKPIFFLAAIPLLLLVILHQQVKANWVGGFNCFGEPQCVAGWSVGLGAAVTDWHSGLYTHSLNSGDYNCWADYTDAKCHGFIHAYIYEWTQLWLHEHNMTRTDAGNNTTNSDSGNNTRWTIHTQNE
jgi:hypothetical protein